MLLGIYLINISTITDQFFSTSKGDKELFIAGSETTESKLLKIKDNEKANVCIHHYIYQPTTLHLHTYLKLSPYTKHSQLASIHLLKKNSKKQLVQHNYTLQIIDFRSPYITDTRPITMSNIPCLHNNHNPTTMK